jgi:hypothetical protein
MINENTALKNRNMLCIGMPGSGKSQALKQRGIMAECGRVLLFDPNKDHKCEYRVDTRAGFARKLAELEERGGRYSLGYSPSPASDSREDDHEFFCKCVLLIADGRKLTCIVDEELAQSCRSASKADRAHKKLMNEGRKYGLVYHGAIQLAQRVPKDVYDQCDTLYVGKNLRLPKYVEQRFTKEQNREIRVMQPLNFLVALPSGDVEKIQLKYKK